MTPFIDDDPAVTVLLVDDDDGDRLHASRCIRKSELDCEILEAADIEPALAEHGAKAVDLILLDYNLPSGRSLDSLQLLQDQDLGLHDRNWESEPSRPLKPLSQFCGDMRLKGQLSFWP